MTKVIEALIQARRDFIERERVQAAKPSSDKQQSVGNNRATASFNQAADALSLQLGTGLELEVTESITTDLVDDKPKTAVDDWLSRLTVSAAEGPGVSRWSKVLLTRLADCTDKWNRERFVQRQERQTTVEWATMFGRPSLFGA